MSGKALDDDLSTVEGKPGPERVIPNYEEWLKNLVANTHRSGDVIGLASIEYGIPEWARNKLENAYFHLFAAMMSDFIRLAETKIVPEDVQMDSGEVKTSRQYLVDSLTEEILGRLTREQPGSAKFTVGIKTRMDAILACFPLESVSSQQSGEVIKEGTEKSQ